MRWYKSLLALAVLATGAFGAQKTTEERFAEFHSKQLSSSPIKLNEKSYRSLTSAPRDYTVVVLLTAMEPRLGCKMCREFQPEWDLLARSWTRGDKSGSSRVILGLLDFAEGREIFLSLGLQTAPVLVMFPPTIGPHAVPTKEPLRYDFSAGGISANDVHGWISRNTPDRPHPPITRPVNWLAWGVSAVSALAIGTVIVLNREYILPVVQSRNVWAAGSLIAILLFISGHMFNHIRKVPYVVQDGRGGISYFAGGFQSQYGLETQVVAAIYGVLSFCAISLVLRVPRIADPKAQQFAVMAWGGAIFVVYSFLLSVFKIKNSGYPFALPPFM